VKWQPRSRRIDRQFSELSKSLGEISGSVSVIVRRVEALDALVRDLHTDAWNANALRTEAINSEIAGRTDRLHALITQNHADTWEADEKRALGLADVVLLSIAPQIEAIKRELIALVGEKAVEVFHEESRRG
jgi:hypothetical protein